MADWRPVFSQGGNAEPRRCFFENGEMYLIVYQRVGKDPELDDTRRVCGMGADRASAWESLRRNVSEYDTMARYVSS